MNRLPWTEAAPILRIDGDDGDNIVCSRLLLLRRPLFLRNEK